jgi:RNA polymerase sigma-70 factor (ECF subfamily)
MNEVLHFSCMIFWEYLRGVDAAPFQPVSESLAGGDSALAGGVPQRLLEELWQDCDAAAWGLGRGEFDSILLNAGIAQNYGLEPGATASPVQRAAFFRGLKLADFVLARACAGGNERAWEHFVAIYHEALVRASIAISGSETVGRDLADALYAELYGLTERDGRRRCPLDSYRGRGSLLGWLRTTLAQRHVDHFRRSYREQPLEEFDTPAPDRAQEGPPVPLPALALAVEQALRQRDAEEQFLLAAYYLDGRTLAQIAGILHVHEATISRRLRRATESVRKQVLRNLRSSGISGRAAEEALGLDPRDLDLQIDLKRLMQSSLSKPFTDETVLADTAPEGTTFKKAAE